MSNLAAISGPALLARMARNNAWANARLHGAVAELGDDGFRAPRPGFFPSLQQTLFHILLVDLYYVGSLEGQSRRAIFEEWPRDIPLSEVTERQQEVDQRLIAFVEGLGADDLAREMPTDRGPAGQVMERADDLLIHLFQHQIHHRGQAHTMLSEAGAAPPQLDEFHLRYDRHPTAAAFDA
ncbi:MAG: DinB family protein [Pseudomonadota bacterium]